MKSALYVSDLDGTLLQADGYLSAFGRETLADLTARGVPFTVASGRSFSSIRRALGTTRLNLPIISSDGALISTYDSPAPLHMFPMDNGPLEEVMDYLLEEGYSPVLDVWDGTDNYLFSREPQNPATRWFHDLKSSEEFTQWRLADDVTPPRGSQVLSLTLLDRPEWLEPLRDDLEERFGDTFKTDYGLLGSDMPDGAALWIQHKDARKEKALEVLCQMLGYAGANVVVFGDELNDLGMFGREWHAVAVSNARDELKACATEIIGHHSDDAVARYIWRQHTKEDLKGVIG